MLEGRLGGVASLAQKAQRAAEAARAHVGVEGEPVLRDEPAAHPRRLEAPPAQLHVAPAAPRRALQLVEQRPQPRGRLARPAERTAAQAGPVARGQRVAGAPEELDVPSERLAGGAGRAAEDSGGLHRREEDALVGGVARGEGAQHLGVGGQHGAKVAAARAATLPEIGRRIWLAEEPPPI